MKNAAAAERAGRGRGMTAGEIRSRTFLSGPLERDLSRAGFKRGWTFHKTWHSLRLERTHYWQFPFSHGALDCYAVRFFRLFTRAVYRHFTRWNYITWLPVVQVSREFSTTLTNKFRFASGFNFVWGANFFSIIEPIEIDFRVIHNIEHRKETFINYLLLFVAYYNP